MVLSNQNVNKSKYPSSLRWVLRRLRSSLFLLLIVLLFGSCGKQTNKKNSSPDRSLFVFKSIDKHLPDYALFNEAKYSDLPVPLGFSFVDKAQIDIALEHIKSDYLSYQGSLGLLEVVSFYNKTLEREGWKIIDLSNEYEGLLICSKPTKNAVISIRGLKKNRIDISIFVQNLFKEKTREENRLIGFNQNNFELSSESKNIINLGRVNPFEDKTGLEDNINSKSIAEYRSDFQETLNFSELKIANADHNEKV